MRDAAGAHVGNPWLPSRQPGATSEPRGGATLGALLRRFVMSQLEATVERYVPGLVLPRLFAGHVVGADVRADLISLLALLHHGGVRAVAGMDAEDSLRHLIAGIDGDATHTFFSYRLAEALLRFGPWQGNPLLASLSLSQRTEVERAVDARADLDVPAPRNYVAVLARCEVARAALGLDVEPALVDKLVERTRGLMREHPSGQLDDSADGAGRFDIYGPAMYLVAEPFAHRLGEDWLHGARRSVELVHLVASRTGVAIPWGRSSGALGVCLTVEFAALVNRRPELGDPTAWAARATATLPHLERWFDAGLVTAHRHRSDYAYRGPSRRLQMTLDCLGKLAEAANSLDSVDPCAAERPADRDQVFWFDGEHSAGVWSYRTTDTAFVVPLVGTSLSDYAPSPQNPGLFEVPVDSGTIVGVPFAVYGDRTVAPLGLAASVTHTPGALDVEHTTWVTTGQRHIPNGQTPVWATRSASYRVEGRTLTVTERLAFGALPDAVGLHVTETTGRPLAIRFRAREQDHATVIDVAGTKDFRSYYAELPVLHQLDLEPAPELSFEWSVTPMLRVASTAYGHHYDVSLYTPLCGSVHEVPFPREALAGEVAALEDIDQVHFHWPERLLPADLDAHCELISSLRAAEVRVVLTQHNLAPHDRRPEWHPIYAAWAAAAGAVIHHSDRGRAQAMNRLPYAPDAQHWVIPHGHFGDVFRGVPSDARARVEAEFGLRRGVVRLAVVGAPRPEKDVQLVIDAVADSRRRDIELLVLSGTPGLHVPGDDERITVVPYKLVPRDAYNRRLAAVDVLVLPFTDGEMLATGTTADAVGAGIPALISAWDYLHESMGEAGIPYGTTANDLRTCIDALDDDVLSAARAATARRRDELSWERIAPRHLQALEQLGTAKL